jgi:predicted GIY-YIG superfamily endonuclease
MHSVYILECCDGAYYVGLAQDVVMRFKVHSSGNGPSFTAQRLPVRLVYQEAFENLVEATRRERQLKGWSRAKKAALIAQNFKLLSDLSVCHQTRSK